VRGMDNREYRALGRLRLVKSGIDHALRLDATFQLARTPYLGTLKAPHRSSVCGVYSCLSVTMGSTVVA
jgi:hypothetical protein